MKLQESQTLFWPRPGKTLNAKTTKFWYSRYIPSLAKSQKLKIAGAEDKILMNTVSKGKPLIHYILEVYDLSEENGLDTYMSMEVPVSEGEEAKEDIMLML